MNREFEKMCEADRVRQHHREHHIYRGYIIRWSVFTLDKPDNRLWVEKGNAFICWANSVEDAQKKIDEVAG